MQNLKIMPNERDLEPVDKSKDSVLQNQREHYNWWKVEKLMRKI